MKTEEALAAIDGEIAFIKDRVKWPSWPLITGAVLAFWTHISLLNDANIESARYAAMLLGGFTCFSLLLNLVVFYFPPRNEPILQMIHFGSPVYGRLTYFGSAVCTSIPLSILFFEYEAFHWWLIFPVGSLYSVLFIVFIYRIYQSYKGKDRVLSGTVVKGLVPTLCLLHGTLLWATIASITAVIDIAPTLGEFKVMVPICLPIPILAVLLMTHDRPSPMRMFQMTRKKLLMGDLTPEGAVEQIRTILKGP